MDSVDQDRHIADSYSQKRKINHNEIARAVYAVRAFSVNNNNSAFALHFGMSEG